jgi:hypothetical protein
VCGHRVVITGGVRPVTLGSWLVRATRPTWPYGRPSAGLNLFLIHIGLNNSRNSIKFLKYIGNKIKIRKIQDKFPHNALEQIFAIG